MRILQVITLCELGGAQTVVVNLANSLINDNEVIVAAGAGDGKMWELLNPRVKQEHIKTLVRELSPVNEFKTLFSLRQLYKKYQPDIIHLHSSKVGILGRIAFPKCKIVYTVHGFDSIRIAYRKYLPIERYLQNWCHAIVGVSQYDKCKMKDEGIVHNVHVVYNGIQKPKDLMKRNPFTQLSNRPRVLCIARLTPQKNHDLFLKVAALMPDVDFFWIGNQEEPDFNYSNNVHFLGSLQHADSYINYADLLMLPSNYEGLPMVIIEALALSKPVVASRVGGIAEIVRDGVNGFALENRAELFVEKIRILLNDKEMYKKLCKESFSIYQNELTVDKMVDGYKNIYSTICKD